MDFFANYGIFLAKTTTIVIATLVLLAFAVAILTKSKKKTKGKLSIRKINEKFDEIANAVNEVILNKAETKIQKKLEKQQKKKKEKLKNPQPRMFVIHFDGDMKASAVDALREEITAILLTAKPEDRVLCCLESPGGMVHAYGLAASQLRRFRAANIKLIVAVDKVAASGGYMMACVADEIVAAPFAVIGSIGVVAQLPNFHRYLEKKNIDFELLTAGEYKRTLTMFGKNTEKGREKMQEEIDDAHELFKTFISENRPKVEINKVGTGEYWYGTRALALNLIDSIQTSDDYILSAKENWEIYKVTYDIKKSFFKKFTDASQQWMNKIIHPEF